LSIENFNPLFQKRVHFRTPFLPFFLWLCLVSFFFFSCSNRNITEQIYQRTQFLLGTVVEITVVSNDPETANGAIKAAFDRIKEIEYQMTAKRSGSLVDKISLEAIGRPIQMTRELCHVIEVCQNYSRMTNGAFDITIGPVTKLWLFDEGIEEIPKVKAVYNAMQYVGFERIHFDKEKCTIELDREGMSLDLGGAAKGYAVDEAVKKIKAEGIDAGIVNAGGDLMVFGAKPGGIPWTIGIQDPEYSDRIIATISLNDMALVTSGDYERYIIYQGAKYHHIINPKTGWPARGCKSVSVASSRAFDADILSTAIFVLGPEEGMKLLESLPDVEGMIMDASGKIHLSSGWKDKLNPSKNPVL
jgi:thiamine biosynthesis lipoprotein